MAVFRFHLQAVLDHKQRQEDVKQQAYAQAQADLQRAAEALAQLHTEAAAARDLMQKRYLVGPLNVWVVQQGWRHLDVLTSQITAQTTTVTGLQEETETKRQELITAMQERKVLEKLKERLRIRWQREQDRLEARFVDELAVTRHARDEESAFRQPLTQRLSRTG